MNVSSSTDHDSRPPKPSEWVGIILLWCGAGVIMLSVWNRTLGLPFDMPGFWYRHQLLWGFIGLAILMIGGGLVKQFPEKPLKLRWRPERLGRRFHSIQLYTKTECPLCEEALIILEDYSDYLPSCEILDIASNPEWEANYADKVPVVVCDGKVRFRGRINDVLLRRLIRGTPPLAE